MYNSCTSLSALARFSNTGNMEPVSEEEVVVAEAVLTTLLLTQGPL